MSKKNILHVHKNQEILYIIVLMISKKYHRNSEYHGSVNQVGVCLWWCEEIDNSTFYPTPNTMVPVALAYTEFSFLLFFFNNVFFSYDFLSMMNINKDIPVTHNFVQLFRTTWKATLKWIQDRFLCCFSLRF